MGEYVTAVRALLRGEEASFEGRRFTASWKHFSPPADVPLYIACAGPRVLRLAAQVADGMVIFMGFSPEILAFVQETIAEACAEVGRDPAELDVWWQTTVNFAPTVEEAMERSLGRAHELDDEGESLEGKGIPPELRRAAAPVQRGHGARRDDVRRTSTGARRSSSGPRSSGSTSGSSRWRLASSGRPSGSQSGSRSSGSRG